jgi:predicted enzyme related to lactoylglutathione lyase
MEMQNGASMWFDIPVSNFKNAERFYKGVFKWSLYPMNDEYQVIKVGNTEIGGIRKAHGKVQDADTTVLYLNVENIAEGAKKVTEFGGELVGEMVPIEDGKHGYFHLFRDLDRNLLSLWSSKAGEPAGTC